jgi:hypothetical protein
MCEMLRLGAVPSDIGRSDRIRMFALHLINYRACESVTATPAAAAMLVRGCNDVLSTIHIILDCLPTSGN